MPSINTIHVETQTDLRSGLTTLGPILHLNTVHMKALTAWSAHTGNNTGQGSGPRTTPTLPDDAPLTPRPAPDLHEQQRILQLGASLGLFYACTRSSALHPMLPAVAKPDRMLPSSGEGKKPLTSSWTPRASSWRATSSWTPRASWRSTSSPRASWRQPASSQPAQEHQEWHSVGERGSSQNGVGQTPQTRY